MSGPRTGLRFSLPYRRTGTGAAIIHALSREIRTMSNPMLMTALLACAAAAHATGDNEAANDAGWHVPPLDAAQPVAPLQMSGVLDLVPDLGFNESGQRYYPLDDDNGQEEWAFRVFPRAGGGWWLAGNHWNASSGAWDAGLVQVAANSDDVSKYTIATPMNLLNDVAFDATANKLYFAGSTTLAGHSDTYMAVTCIDVGTTPPVKCSGFGTDGTAFVAFDIASGKNDGAWRVLVRPNLGVLLVGWAQNGASGNAIAAAALSGDDGGLIARFGNNGKYWIDFADNDNIHAIALSDDADTEARLYIAGSYEVPSDPGRIAGFALALNAWTGQPDAGFGSAGRVTLAPRLRPVGSNDGASALAVLADGKLAWSGWSLDGAGNRRLVVGRLNVDGSPDNSFHHLGWVAPVGAPPAGQLQHARPTDMAERPGNHDLVIAFEVAFDGTSPNAGEHRQFAYEYDADVRTPRGAAWATWDYSGSGGPWATPSGLLVTHDAVMMAGTQRYNVDTGDLDYTLLRLIRADTIFADGFDDAR